MTEERGESLAEQAAAWVPPWLRTPKPQPAGQASSPPGPADPSQPVGGDEPIGSHVAEAAPLVAEAAPLVAEPAPLVAEAAMPAAEPEVPAAGPAESVAGTDARLALLDDGELRSALEAILLVVDEPVPETVLGQVLEQPVERVTAMLEQLARDYTAEGRGFDLRRAAGGWRLYTRAEYAAYVERFVLDGQSVRLTQAALETLAVVAYKQPVTRSRISAIRGVNCDGVVRTLVTRGLIEECGTEPETGAYLYRTTALFLEKLGLDTLDQLPSLAPFLPDDVEEIADAAH